MKNPVCWIDVEGGATNNRKLRQIYNGVRGPGGQLDNLYQAFSLRSHTILPADDLYKAALHNENNTVPACFAELLGTYVAILAECDYARAHHGHNFTQLYGNANAASEILGHLENDELDACGTAKEVSALRYVRMLCLTPGSLNQEHIKALSSQGWPDGEILEIVQIVAMFSYFVRVINGLGIQLGDEKLGLY